MIINSIYTIGPEQVDGRSKVNEKHTNDDGRVFDYEWLSDNTLNPQDVLEGRAIVIDSILAAREAALIFVVGTEVPYTKHQFLSRFTSMERIAIRNFAKSSHPYAASINDFMEMLNASGGVYMTLAREGIAALQALGLVTPERAQIIGAD